jgi:hypothetical protein
MACAYLFTSWLCRKKKSRLKLFLLPHNTDYFWHLICGSFSPHTNKQASNSEWQVCPLIQCQLNTIYLVLASDSTGWGLSPQDWPLCPIQFRSQSQAPGCLLWCVWICIGLPRTLFLVSMNVSGWLTELKETHLPLYYKEYYKGYRWRNTSGR